MKPEILKAIDALGFEQTTPNPGVVISFDLDASPSTYVVLTVGLSVCTLFPVTFMNIGTYQVVVTEIDHGGRGRASI